MVGEWKKQAMEGLAAVFSDRSVPQETAKSSAAEGEKLRAKNSQLRRLPGRNHSLGGVSAHSRPVVSASRRSA
jgi:hypothetical protein